MVKRLIVACAAITGFATLGPAVPANADNGISWICNGPNLGAERNDLSFSATLGGFDDAIGSISDLNHPEKTIKFNYACGNGSLSNVGNTTNHITIVNVRGY
jgi:hypothetical protein